MLQELRHSLRSLRRSPGLTAISIVTVGLGVGAGTTLFTVVKSVLLNPLPFPDPSLLVRASSLDDARTERRVSLPDFDDWRAQSRSFASLAAYSTGAMVASGDTPERATGALVTEEFFDVLGVRPMLGRSFTPDEHRQAPLSTAVLSNALWQRAYGGNPSLIGRQIRVLGFPSTVIGIMPPRFSFPEGTDLWVSARATREGNVRTAPNFWVIGRLRPGQTAETAARDLDGIAAGLKRRYPAPSQAAGATASPLALHLTGSVRAPLLILFGAVGILLLIVCVNVANLLLVRHSVRSREIAMRITLGASGLRIFRFLLIESLLLAAAGGALGFLLAVWSMDLIRLILPAALPRASEVSMDAGVFFFAVALAGAAGLLFGTLPAARASCGLTPGRATQRTQGLLVISEVALSMLLLAGAGLLLGSYVRLSRVNPGFQPDGVLAVNLSAPVTRDRLPRIVPSRREIAERLRALPGVESAGLAKDLPLDPFQRHGRFRIENRPDGASEAGYEIAGPGTLETLRIPIIRGRGFTEADAGGAPAVAIVNEEMARRYWGARDPIGERIWFESFERERWLTVVGVAGNVRQNGLTEPAPPQAYVSYAQLLVAAQVGSTNLVIRSAVSSKTLIPQIRQAVREVDPDAAVTFRGMNELVSAAVARQRFQLQMLAAFAALALLLAAVGLYGVLSYSVASNRPAFAIRMALGARPAHIFRVVAVRALALTGAGAAIGLAACVAFRGILGKLVFGIGPADPGVLAGAAAVLFIAAFAACWFPARRAMRLDPNAALRGD